MSPRPKPQEPTPPHQPPTAPCMPLACPLHVARFTCSWLLLEPLVRGQNLRELMLSDLMGNISTGLVVFNLFVMCLPYAGQPLAWELLVEVAPQAPPNQTAATSHSAWLGAWLGSAWFGSARLGSARLGSA
mgnify:CR=1 FL=1